MVTGAASGIGRELARIAARDGSFMMLVDKSGAALEAVAAELKQAGAEAHALTVDLTDPGAGEAIADALREKGLYCDVLVNNAGFGLVGPTAQLDRAEQMRLLAVNIRAPTELSLRFLPGMLKRRRGGILNVGSLSAYMPGPNMALYTASKAYVRALSAALAGEVAGTGVTVTCLAPGMVRTAFYERLSIARSRLFKLIPRAGAAATAAAGWRSFRAGKRLVIPRLINRIILGFLVLVPGRLVRWVSGRMIPAVPAPAQAQPLAQSLKPCIVVTGASQGIGREIARGAAREGCARMLIARSLTVLEDVAAELSGIGVEALVLAADLARPRAGERIEEALRERDLYCDVLVNDAGICLAGPASGLARDEQLQLIDLNIGALTDLALRFLPGMLGRRRGGILNVGSIGAYMAAPNMAVYHASKAYVASFSASLAAETAGTGVLVTCLCPGVVRTRLVKNLPLRPTRLSKLVPRSNADATAAAGWSGFRAGKQLVIPRLVDRLLAAGLILMPRWAIPPVPVIGDPNADPLRVGPGRSDGPP